MTSQYSGCFSLEKSCISRMAWLVEIEVCSGRVDTVVPDWENLLTTICSRRLHFVRVSQMSVGTDLSHSRHKNVVLLT